MFAVLSHFHIPGCRAAFKVKGFYDDKIKAQQIADSLYQNRGKHSCTTHVEVRDIGGHFEIPDIKFKPISNARERGVATSLQSELQHWL